MSRAQNSNHRNAPWRMKYCACFCVWLKISQTALARSSLPSAMAGITLGLVQSYRLLCCASITLGVVPFEWNACLRTPLAPCEPRKISILHPPARPRPPQTSNLSLNSRPLAAPPAKTALGHTLACQRIRCPTIPSSFAKRPIGSEICHGNLL